MIALIDSLDISESFYFVADAYYASGKIVRGLLAKGNQLITRVKSNAVAYWPAPAPDTLRHRGRPKTYGEKIKVASLIKDQSAMTEAASPIYGGKNVVLKLRSVDLLWRPVGILIRFVAVIHPVRGSILLMSTDLNLSPL